MTNLSVTRLSIGTAQFGMNYGIANKTGQTSFNEVVKIIDLARRSGINTLDTAISYGKSEQILGEVGIQDFQVITKLPEISSDVNTESWMREQVENSLSRLKIRQLHGLLLHYPKQLFCDKGEDIIGGLVKIREQGLVKEIGISVYSPEELDNIFTKFTPDIVQLPFNIVDRRFLHSGWLSKLQKYQVEVHTRSSFLQGLLLMSCEEVMQKFPHWSELWNRWFIWLEDNQISPVFACLSFVLSFAEAHRVIIGVDHSHHLADILNMLSNNSEIRDFPSIATDDVKLINPSLWKL